MNTVRARVWRFSVETQTVRAQSIGEGALPVSLARLLHINAMACDPHRTLSYWTRRSEVRLMASYLHAPDGGSPLLVDHQAFEASSRHIRSFVNEGSGLGMLTAAGESLFAWKDGAHDLHNFDALPKHLLGHYRPTGVRPDLLFHLPAGPVAGEARGRHRRAAQLLPERLLAGQKQRLRELASWSAAHRDHTYFMSWVWIGPSGIAVDIFLPEGGPWNGALDAQWMREHAQEGPATRFPLHEPREQRAARRRAPQDPGAAEERIAYVGQASDDGPRELRTALNIFSEVYQTHEGGAPIPPGSPQQQAAGVMEWLYETAPAGDGAALAGILVRGTWAAADAAGPARHAVLLGVLAEQPPRQAAVRDRLARAEGHFDACLDGRLLTVVRPAASPVPSWRDLERALLEE